MRYPRENSPFGPVDDGSYLTMYWIDEGKLGTQQAWVSEQMKLLAEVGRTFDERSVQTATAYDHLGSWERDVDGVPPFLALDHRYAGVVWAVLERTDDASVEDLAAWLAGEFLPAALRRLTGRDRRDVLAAPEGAVVACGRARGTGRRGAGVRHLLRRDRRPRRVRSLVRDAGRRPRRDRAEPARCSWRRSSRPSPAPTPTSTNSGSRHRRTLVAGIDQLW